ncbi:Tetratricopeptide repeat-containing protein [Seinonella peptonophila]|uniref:Tetratricopeptide repeat-containing protein n=1 Tax=Seinonella peptonophila TaxID=112248 RepID=A0A1M5AXB0_9BACL|nr:helix-turn-helix domain-containing protein [Seinonella peptonophila]SHF34786.1 Tetratricopeptide repeat-containing protein [Seinonella peptonophila]
MIHSDRKVIGEALRKVRKQNGWSIENVAKMMETLSSATLSNIERGIPSVTEKYIQEYCTFLKIPFKKLPSIIQEENTQKKSIQRKLLRIEKLTDIIDPEKVYKELKSIPVPTNNHLKVLYLHLEGRCLYYKRNYEKARKRFNQAIVLLNKYPELEYTNIRSACFVELGRIAFFYQNDLEQALHYSDLGLKAFQEDGLRSFIKLSLLSGKASYLEKMHQDEEALLTVEKLLKEKDNWHKSLDSLLNAIEIKAILCSKKGYHLEALNYAEEGIELARLNKHYSRAVELLTAMGDICFSKKDYGEAEDWYSSALPLEKKIKQKYFFVTTYTRLGKLYMTLSDWDKAKEHLIKAVDLGKKNDDGIRYYTSLVTLGDFYIKTQEPESAIIFLEKAKSLSENNNFPFTDPELYLKLSHCYEEVDSSRSKNYLAKYKVSKLEFN